MKARRGLLGLGFVGGLVLGLLVTFWVERLGGAGRVARGVVFERTPLAGQDQEALRRAFRARASELAERPLRFVVDGHAYERKAGELGLAVDVDRLVDEALGAGRSGSIASQIGFWLAGLVRTHELELAPKLDAARLESVLAEWEKERLPRPRTGRVWFDGRAISSELPSATRAIDRARFVPLLLATARTPKPIEPMIVPVRETPPALREETVTARVRDFERVLSGDTTLVTDDGAHRLRLAGTAVALTLETAVDGAAMRLVFRPARLAALFDSVRAEIERPALPTRFQFDPSGRPSILPSEKGVSIDLEASGRELLRAAATPERSGRLVLAVAEPAGLAVAEAEALGVKGLVARFTTHHACCEARVKNIQSVAKQIDGLVLRPGETFSLNRFLGPRTNEGGYEEAPTIVRGKMKQTAGGGISQFATTLFNAVLDGGYKIVQRQPHSFYFPRYPEGHEATVSYPSPDLVFENDTKFGLVIKTEYGPTFIRVLLYGDNEGRRVERSVSRRSRPVPPPTEYVPNDELLPGDARTVAHGQAGWTVLVGRKIHFADGTTREEGREVVYQPRPDLVEVHSCMIPKGEKGHTGEPCPEPEEPEELEEEGEREVEAEDVPPEE